MAKQTVVTEPTTGKNPIHDVQRAIEPFLRGHQELRVLEAGCGSGSHLEFGHHAYVVGIDISPEQLANNPLLHERILGDVTTYPLPEQAFDVIVCWDVLEHLRRPELALANFVQAVRDDGIIVLQLPNVYSLKGLITKLTPHWFHVLIYRVILRHPTAGQPGSPPFPTFLRWSIAPNDLKTFARQNGLTVEYFSIFEGWAQYYYRTRYGLAGGRWRVLQALVNVLTFGRISADLTDFTIVLRKPEARG